jgi:predicted Zn-dependent protease
MVEQAQTRITPGIDGAGLKPAPIAVKTALRSLAIVTTLFRKLMTALLCAALIAAGSERASAQGAPNIIRDAEIEGFLRLIAKPIFSAAGINPGAARVYVIADSHINAFVAGGQRIFINTGLISKTRTPNEIAGVIAHESGHISGGHLARLNNEIARASTERIIGMLVGAAAMVGGAMANNSSAAQMGKGVIMGSQGMAQRNLLAYQRSMEASADQAALKYLAATKQSPKGMLDLFGRMANDAIASLDGADPYAFSHPMPLDRIRTLEVEARKSPNFDKTDNAGMVLRHQLAKAKLAGFLESPQQVFTIYPKSDVSLPARYARAIALFRRGDIGNAIPIIDSLIADLPEDPYFYELKAQAYLENGQPANGLPAIAKARTMLPNNALILELNAALLLAMEQPSKSDEALSLLRRARQAEPDLPALYKDMARAYGMKNDIARANLATAEYAWLTGDIKMAQEKAQAAQDRLPQGTPEWLRANDLVTFTKNKSRK